MVKPAATNMTITLQQNTVSGPCVKPLVVGEQMVVHTNAAGLPILPHQPVAAEQDQSGTTPSSSLSLERIAGLSLSKFSVEIKLENFTRAQIDLFYRRYTIKKDT